MKANNTTHHCPLTYHLMFKEEMIYSFETQRTKKQALICSPLRQIVGHHKVPDPLHATLFADHSYNSSNLYAWLAHS